MKDSDALRRLLLPPEPVPAVPAYRCWRLSWPNGSTSTTALPAPATQAEVLKRFPGCRRCWPVAWNTAGGSFPNLGGMGADTDRSILL